MSLSVNGHSQVPPGFRFHPTEEELLHYYLRKKVTYQKIDLDVIRDVDLNKLEPWDIQEKCKIGSGPQNDWYFFSHKDKKYPTGTRTNRATAAGFWKATGRDKVIYSSHLRIGMRKTLVFYKGRAPHGQKSDWIMHEYRLDDPAAAHGGASTGCNNNSSSAGDSMSSSEDGWVVCRVFRKKICGQKTTIVDCSLKASSGTDFTDTRAAAFHIPNPQNGDDAHGVLDQILMYMGRSGASACKQEQNDAAAAAAAMDIERYMHLPRLESPTQIDHDLYFSEQTEEELNCTNYNDGGAVRGGGSCETAAQTQQPPDGGHHTHGHLNNWAAMDRLLASQLNGQVHHEKANKQSTCVAFGDGTAATVPFCISPENGAHERPTTDLRCSIRGISSHQATYGSDNDLWGFNRCSSSSSSDPLSHLSV